MKLKFPKKSLTILMIFAFNFLAPHFSLADASGGSVALGNSTGLSADGLTYNAAGNAANVLAYNAFSISQNQAFNAQNPNSAGSNLGIFVNGGLPTTIAGQFNAPGFNVLFVNNSGFTAANGATFNVATFAATTRQVDLGSLQNWANGSPLAVSAFPSSGNVVIDNTGLFLDAALNIPNPGVLQGELMYLQLPPGVTVAPGVSADSSVISAALANDNSAPSTIAPVAVTLPVVDNSATLAVSSVPTPIPATVPVPADNGIFFGAPVMEPVPTAPSLARPIHKQKKSDEHKDKDDQGQTPTDVQQ